MESTETNDDIAERRIAAAPETFGISAEDAELFLRPIADDPDRLIEVANGLAALRYEQDPDRNKSHPAQGRRQEIDAPRSVEAIFTDHMENVMGIGRMGGNR